jgi:hypothetical protein
MSAKVRRTGRALCRPSASQDISPREREAIRALRTGSSPPNRRPIAGRPN